MLTQDIYFTNKDLNGMSENEMKNAFIRLRSCNNGDYKVQNSLIPKLGINVVKKKLYLPSKFTE